ncbi:MAG: PepSY domain-containing protein [Candidatus Faecivicinus sp.]|nr:PepSY domain-containing protein [Candidatus Faecivicinus sp.]
MNKTMKTFLMILLALLTLLIASAYAQSAVDQTAAENLALEAAGATRDRATLYPTETETEHGRTVYDVEFKCDGMEYEFWIDSANGMIVKRSWEYGFEKTLEMAQQQGFNTSFISAQEAFGKALADAGLAESEVTMTEISLDTDDALRVYEVSFFTASTEYEYDVDAITGAICATSVEFFEQTEAVRPGEKPASGSTAGGTTGGTTGGSQNQEITRDKARSIALADAGLSASDVTFTKSKLDREDGVLVYEIEFVTSSAEYEYEINAASGKIVEKKVESHKTAQGNQSSSSAYIGVDQAKRIALKHAGLSDATFTKAKLENDDGNRVYEIEFRKDGVEYEYEIDAVTGSILEYDVEQDERAAEPSKDRYDDDDDDDRYDDHDDDDDDRYDDDDDDDRYDDHDDDDDDRYDDDDDDDDDDEDDD